MGTRQGIVGFVYFLHSKIFLFVKRNRKEIVCFRLAIRHLHTSTGAGGSSGGSGSGGGGRGGSDEEKSDSFPFQEKLFSVKFEKAFWTDKWTDGPMDGPTDEWTDPLIEMRGHI